MLADIENIRYKEDIGIDIVIFILQMYVFSRTRKAHIFDLTKYRDNVLIYDVLEC